EKPTVRIKFEYEIFNEENTLIHQGKTLLAFVNTESGRPCRPPELMMNVIAPFFKWTPGLLIILWMRSVKFKQWDNVSLYKIIKLFVRDLMENEILIRANGVAFSFILAIFPAIIFLFTLIPYITQYVPEVNTESIMAFLAGMMPASMYDVIASTVHDIISNQRGGLLTLGFVFSLYLATNGMMSLMSAFNACYKTNDKRGGL